MTAPALTDAQSKRPPPSPTRASKNDRDAAKPAMKDHPNPYKGRDNPYARL
jgi:hypothetical protein